MKLFQMLGSDPDFVQGKLGENAQLVRFGGGSKKIEIAVSLEKGERFECVFDISGGAAYFEESTPMAIYYQRVKLEDYAKILNREVS